MSERASKCLIKHFVPILLNGRRRSARSINLLAFAHSSLALLSPCLLIVFDYLSPSPDQLNLNSNKHYCFLLITYLLRGGRARESFLKEKILFFYFTLLHFQISTRPTGSTCWWKLVASNSSAISSHFFSVVQVVDGHTGRYHELAR